MSYEKTIRDHAGDGIDVAALPDGEDQEPRVRTESDDLTMLYTPSQARKLAKALKRAANVAEGKPAKTPKAKQATITDGDGDTWHLCPNGLYSMTEGNTDAHFTAAGLIGAYGIQGQG